MGFIKHNIISVSSYNEAEITEAYDKALEIFNAKAGVFEWNIVSNILSSPVNGYKTFFIAPDGSKIGWNDREIGDERRADFCQWLDAQDIDYVEVSYGGDSEIPTIERANPNYVETPNNY